MGTVKHKIFGMAKIIRRDGDRITIKYDKDGTVVELKIPDSFITKPCLFVLFHFGFEAVVADAPVRGPGKELDAHVDHLTAEIGIAETDSTAVDVVLLADTGKFFNGGEDFGAADLAGLADAVGEVGRAEEEYVDALDRGDLFSLFKSGGILDLSHDKGVVIGELDVLRQRAVALIGILVHSIDTPETQGVELALFDDEFKLLFFVDMGDHESLGACFKRLDEVSVVTLAVGGADHHVDAGDLGGAQDVFQSVGINVGVFVADPQHIVTCVADHFSHVGVHEVDFCRKDRFAAAHLFSDDTCFHK